MSTDNSQPIFVGLIDNDSNLRLLNLSQIAWNSAPQGAESIELRMSDGNVINLNGKEVCYALLKLVARSAVTPFGQPLWPEDQQREDERPSSGGFQTKVK